MNLNDFKRDYKFRSQQSQIDGRRNKTLIIACIVIIIVAYYVVQYLK